MLSYLVLVHFISLVRGLQQLEGYELKYVHVVMRIGEHTPSQVLLNLVPESGLTEDNFTSLDQLSANGEKQMENLGASLKGKYGELWKEEEKLLTSAVVAPESFSYSYAQKSKDAEEIDEKVWYSPKLETDMKDVTRAYYPQTCPVYHKEMEKALENAPIPEALKDKLNRIEEEFPNYANDAHKFFFLYELYQMYVKDGHEKPSWMAKDTTSALKKVSEHFLKTIYSTTNFKKLVGGRFLTRLLVTVERLKNDTLNPKDLKMTLFGSTGSFLTGIIAAMGGKEGYSVGRPYSYPRHGAMFVVEVYTKTGDNYRYGEKDGDLYLRFRYKNGGENQKPICDTLILKGCDEICPFEKVKGLLQSMMITNDEEIKECKAENDVEKPS